MPKNTPTWQEQLALPDTPQAQLQKALALTLKRDEQRIQDTFAFLQRFLLGRQVTWYMQVWEDDEPDSITTQGKIIGLNTDFLTLEGEADDCHDLRLDYCIPIEKGDIADAIMRYSHARYHREDTLKRIAKAEETLAIEYAIYALTDPRTGYVRYVGMSQDVESRFRQHCHATSCNPRKDRWMGELLALGMIPVLSILETIHGYYNALACEGQWVRLYASMGAPLTNLDMGGES